MKPAIEPLPTSHPAVYPAVRLVWRDPVTGELLRVVLKASPEMLQRLGTEGFSVEKVLGASITRSAG